ncbi:MAG: hypothetical protein L0387_38550 [Acidobacteria bacterium]|nr:hypothetical protein [Acidobacteriota bacterium]MCI0722747.1 hypothetical protein [Acidobacteriota bacterium]
MNVLRSLELEGTIKTLCQINGYVRQAFVEGEQRIAKVQEFLVSNFLDDPSFRRLQERFPDKRPQDRPIFHPLQILNLLRLVAVESAGPESESPVDSKDARDRLGTAALMMSDLLVSEREELEITEGDEYIVSLNSIYIIGSLLC